jgi:hypothetical protein
MATLDPSAQQDAQGAQEAQNAGMLAFVKLLAELLSGLSNRPVNLDDLTLMSGTRKVFPSDNPDLELTAKVQDAFTNPESKASIRIFLEYPDGRKEQIFRQVQGKIPPGGDPLGLAPAMREMFAKQAADKFTAELRPKVVIEADSQTVTQKPTVFEALAKTVPVAAATRLDEAEPVKDSAADSVEQTEVIQPSEEKNQNLKKELAVVEKSLVNARNNLGSPDFDPVEAQQWVDYFEQKAQSLRAQLGIAEPAAATVEAELVQPTSQTGKPQTVDLPISQAEHNESAILGAIAMPAVVPIVAQAEASLLTLELPVQNSITAEDRNKQFVLDGVAASMTDMPTQDLEEERAFAKDQLEFIEGKIDAFESLSRKGLPYFSDPALDQPYYDRLQSQAREWMSELGIPEIDALRELDSFTGQTIDVVSIKKGAGDSNSAIYAGVIQPFLSEVTELSTQVEALRGQVNQHLGDIALFTQTLGQSINEPQIQQWTQETAAVVEVHSQTLGDRLRNAAAGLLETVKDRAANDWKIVVDTVKERASDDWAKTVAAVQERASDDWAKTVEVVQDRAATDWEKLQRWVISSDRVDAGIDTLLRHVGQNSADGGLAEQDGYVFARKGEERAIFRTGTNEPVYKNGLLTDSANSKDSAYITGFPLRVEKAAAVADAIAQTSAKSSAPSAGRGR